MTENIGRQPIENASPRCLSIVFRHRCHALAQLAGPGPALELGIGTGRVALRSRPTGGKTRAVRYDFWDGFFVRSPRAPDTARIAPSQD